MKYIVTESQMNNLSSNFLDELFDGYEVKYENENRVIYLNDRPVIMLDPNKAVVDSSVLDEMSKVFLIDTINDAKRMIRGWILNRIGVKSGSEPFYGIKFKKLS
jgi:Trm5-related predicted tRNA methylase